MKSFQYRKNIYTCEKCHYEMVTIDRDVGTTPFITSCPMCNGATRSSLYNVDQNATPTHEWYRPDKLSKLKPHTLEHVKRGGLILRPIPPADETWNKFEAGNVKPLSRGQSLVTGRLR